MKIHLKIWRQKDAQSKGAFKNYELDQVAGEMSFLEMLDLLNRQLIEKKDAEGPVCFDSDCREGICGNCGVMINGRAHGHIPGTTTCQLHMRSFEPGSNIVLEPFRAKAFPVIKDLVVDRSSFDTIIQSGGYISVSTGSAVDGNSTLVSKSVANLAMDAAACIGCGACVANCKNASAMLFVAAKVTHFSLLPQGQPERKTRVQKMMKAMRALDFGNCTNEAECEAGCPKNISIASIAKLNREYLSSVFSSELV